ncbi:glycerophosphoryl diester phosphodiesterase [Sediminihabitans luteus]|uniref:Glycerophosphoryl diester phosphodiesterase n=1 Tax=Sediminihabitans luteus TaxID=1138585 RepID=A0A2M9D0Q7_9CELL|nr:glycerophosphodiester phosphodiesterase family protein [Sediminihabitans luteus]PJJ77588.1 glycerophosphoryl diester phosphodiesterase [Sediminihabitans luteus]
MLLHPGRPSVVGHRGASADAPQNTLAAFRLALAEGADGIETDLRLTADGAPAVIHDARVDATTDGRGLVADLTLAQVRALDAGTSFDARFAGQRVPTLDDLVTLLADHPTTELLLELKGVWAASEVAPVVRALQDADVAGRVVVKGFRRETVEAVRTAAPGVRRGLLVEHPTPDLLDACARLDVWTCNPAVALVAADPGLVAALHDAGHHVMVWDADTPEEWELCTALGVDAIMTDHPGALARWFDARAEGARA